MKISISILTLLIVHTSFSQKSVVASGGKAIGTNGSASYSIGLVSFKTPDGNSISDGIQQPFEIQTLGMSDFTRVELTMKAYPNPTIDELKLKITEQNLYDYSYQLYDCEGKILTYNKINIEESSINMKDYSNAVYFLDVKLKDKKIKTFKIIKK